MPCRRDVSGDSGSAIFHCKGRAVVPMTVRYAPKVADFSTSRILLGWGCAPAFMCHICHLSVLVNVFQETAQLLCHLMIGGLERQALTDTHKTCRRYLQSALQAEMKEPLRSLVQLPVDAEGLADRLPQGLRPPGL